VPLTGGTFAGPELNGKLLPGSSADRQTVLPHGTALGDIATRSRPTRAICSMSNHAACATASAAPGAYRTASYVRLRTPRSSHHDPSISAGVCAAFTRILVARSDRARRSLPRVPRPSADRPEPARRCMITCLAADSPLSRPARHSAGRPNRRTAVAGASHGRRSARLADDQRDVAFGAALVTAVPGVGGHHPGPKRRLLLR
jgi:hypothetical protein